MCHATNRPQDQIEKSNAITRPSTAVDLFDTSSFLPACSEVLTNVVTSSIDICQFLHGPISVCRMRIPSADAGQAGRCSRCRPNEPCCGCPKREDRANPIRC